MRALSMHIRNFLSMGRATIPLARQGIVRIDGENRDDPTARSNGAAKSTVVEAFVWCLRGVTLRGLEGDAIINNKVGKNCRVSIKLRDGKTKWRVVRARNDTKLKTSLNVYQNGKRVTGSTIADTQALIDRLLGMTTKTFLSSVVFGQSNAYRFSELTDKDQKAILDEAIGIEVYARAGALAREEANVHRVNVGTLSRDLETLLKDKADVEAELTDLKKKEARFDTDVVERSFKLRQERRALKIKISKTRETDLEALKTSRTVQRDRVDKHETELERIREALVKQRTVVTVSEKEVKQIEHKISRHAGLSGACPTCGEEIDVTKQLAVMKELKKELKSAMSKLAVDDIFLQKTEEALANEQAVGKQLREALTEIAIRIDVATEIVAKVESWREQVATLTTRIEEIEHEKSPYRSLIEKKTRRLSVLLAEHTNVFADLEAEQLKLQEREFWVEAYGAKGLRSMLIDTALPLLNEKVELYAQAITDGAIQIEFKTQTELKSGKTVDRFEVAVTNVHGAESYKGNSAGERAKVDLCVGLALQALVASRARSAINVAFFDEPFESLDDVAVERVAVLLTEELADRESIFVITHNEALKSFFPNVITVIKEKGISYVE